MNRMHDEPLYRLTLLRHGQSVGNRDQIRQGQRDFPLTSRGRSQVEALLKHWTGLQREFDLIIASTLQRALDTAQLLGQGLQIDVQQSPEWMERNAGLAEGLPIEDQVSFRDRYRSASVYEPLFKDGESIVDLHLRGLLAIQRILQRPPGSYLVVSHGGILNAAVRAVLGIAPTGAPPFASFQFNNSGYMDLNFSPQTRSWRIIRSNVCTHLEGSQLE